MLKKAGEKLQNICDEKKRTNAITSKVNYLYSLLAYGPLPRAFEESKLFLYLNHFRSSEMNEEETKAFEVVERVGRLMFMSTRHIDAMPLSMKTGSTDAEMKTAFQRYSS